MESWEEVTEFVVVLEMSPPMDITEKSMHSRGIQCLLPLEVSFEFDVYELDVWRIFQLLKMKKSDEEALDAFDCKLFKWRKESGVKRNCSKR